MSKIKQSWRSRFHAVSGFLFLAIILLLLNVLANQVFFRIDLTKEKRFTLSKATKDLVGSLDDIVYIKVYLDGDFPAGFKKLQSATREMLDEFRSYSRGNLDFVFIDPSEIKDYEQRQEFFRDLYERGLQPTNLKVKGDDGYQEKIIFPGALLFYKGNEIPLQLLENQIGLGPQENINASINLLEYKLASAIRQLAITRGPVVGFLSGHGELSDPEMGDFIRELRALLYNVQRLNLMDIPFIPASVPVVIVAKPSETFSEREKFKIDQYVMAGGRVLWLLDNMMAEMDSLKGKTAFISVPRNLNLEDMLFKYGVRLNPDLVQDIQCNPIPLVVGQTGDAPQTQLFPWFYFPVITSANNHPVNKNLDAVALKFASTIDTIRAPGISKTPLLTTSAYSKALMTPVRVHLGGLRHEPDPRQFQQKNLIVAALLEGVFPSVFKNRLAESFVAMVDSFPEFKIRQESLPGKMIVVADGDIIRNEPTPTGEVAFPLGYYRYTDRTFANKAFLLNCVEYLLDDSGLMQTRNKEIKLRLLDATRVKQEKTKWQMLNVALPIGLILLFGLLYNWIRRRRYAR